MKLSLKMSIYLSFLNNLKDSVPPERTFLLLIINYRDKIPLESLATIIL